MANNPKKVKDPTEVALSAIQEALNIETPSDNADRDSGNDDNNNKDVTNSSSPAFPEPSFDFGSRADIGPTRPERTTVFDALEQPPAARRAANDDRETIGQILQAIQSGRPARSVYTMATLFAAVWGVGA